MNEEKTDNKALSFYGTFALIYTVLNIAAFVILLLTTEWSVLADDEGDGFWIGFGFMVIGIVAALIHGIGPAIVFKRRGKTRQLWFFPLAVMVAGFTIIPFEPLGCTIGLLIYPLGCPLFNCFAYNSAVTDWMTSNIFIFALVTAAIYAFVIFATTFFCTQKRAIFRILSYYSHKKSSKSK